MERLPPRGAITVFDRSWYGRVLVERLRGRGTESEARIRRRMDTARRELEAVGEFDYVVVNDDLDRTLEEIRTIAAGERSRTERVVDLEPLLRDILEAIA